MLERHRFARCSYSADGVLMNGQAGVHIANWKDRRVRVTAIAKMRIAAKSIALKQHGRRRMLALQVPQFVAMAVACLSCNPLRASGPQVRLGYSFQK